MMTSMLVPGHKRPPLIMHIIHRLGVGGLENGLVNLINHMPPERYRHSIVCLTDATDFRYRIQQKDVQIITLNKREGKDFDVYFRFWKALRLLRPDIVHTRNLSGLEYMVPAAFVGIPGRVHGVHGRDTYDPDGLNFKYNMLRRVIRPLIKRYIAVSVELANWLKNTIGARPDRLTQIYNGVDARRFYPSIGPRPCLGPKGFAPKGTFILGTVGRMEEIKDPLTLVRAFLRLIEHEPKKRKYLRLVMIGGGALFEKAQRLLKDSGVDHLAWLPGERSDIPDIMRGMDLFVLPSLREGISNTILEAMATGLPVVATHVGGNIELVVEDKTGMLVPQSDPISMAKAIQIYIADRTLSAAHGHVARTRVVEQFSMEAMVKTYLGVYDAVLNPENRK